jgi:endonuclease YncB( thermonuclease family)
MKRLAAPFLLASALACVTVASLNAVTWVAPEPASAQDRDCSDFPNQRAAQFFFLRHGGPESDPHRLDDAFGEGNGIACEDLPCPCYEGRSPPGGNPPPAQPAPREPKPNRAQTIRSVIVRVIDGDTIVVRPLEETRRPRYIVRLIGIDSPEHSPRECGATLATQRARRLAPRGRRVLLKTDPTQPLFDPFDRLLAYALLRNGPQMNKNQIVAGFAKVLVVGRRSQQYRSFKSAARRAHNQGRGVWGICGGMHVRDR